ncbi:Gfo/Idh/MocA family oxidoreductase [Lachnospiraceae bacterium 48-42]|nr:Gfo/Idh/MocA family oxidoreductase [Dorea sp.]
MKFAILAAGGIARKMAEAVTGIEKAGTVRIQKYAVASRDLSRAEEFAKEWGFEKAYGSYEELAADPEVELVYVASPHSHHYEHAKLCLEHGKHVLVEKAFTVNAAQAEDLMKLAREKQVLLTEAIWTRYMPSRKMIGDLLESGIIGKVSSMTANLGYPLMDVPRLVQPELAGGALLDLGVYSITMALMLFHEEITDVVSAAVFSPEGVDWMNSITFIFADGKMAVLNSNMTVRTDCRAVVNGDEGYMEITEINNPEEIRVFDRDGKLRECFQVPEQINGYEYEVLACIRAIGEGKLECEEMPHSETLRVMRLMDQIRGQWGFRLPCE